eukprot:TRINITY_DN5463_c0_g1_i1.p1 TRINITY_DN5463_c0_g1~~TRINITY_DN5463_c0_g1_i1.p1  ORF type:complete len:210 (+),score=32.16 TRINITY_DN5463_c0_g1_i1:195-824(+)
MLRVLLLSACFISVAFAACNPTLFPVFDSSCDAKTPFCRNTNTTAFPVFNCVACRTNCDCDQNEYCSIDRWSNTVGTCQKIDLSGKACFPMSSLQLVNSTIPSEGKCAVLVTDSQSNLQAVWTGVCMQGKCRACDYSAAAQTCGAESMGPPRVCVFPGEYNTPHSRFWSGGAYYEDPIRVWLAIFFIFILIITLANVGTAFFAFRGSKH